MKSPTRYSIIIASFEKQIPMNYITYKKISNLSYIIFLLLLLISICNVNGQKELMIPENLKNSSLAKEIIQYTRRADSLAKIGNLKQSEVLYAKAYEKAKNSRNDSLLIATGNEYAKQLFDQFGNVSRAKKLNYELMDFCKKKKHSIGFVASSILKASILKSEGKNFEAQQIYSQAIQSIDSTVPKKLVIETYRLRGGLLETMDQKEKARKDYKYALLLIEKGLNSDLKSKLYIDIARTFIETAPDSTVYYSNLILDYCHLKGAQRNCLAAYNNLAYVFVLKGEPQKAKELIEQNINEKEFVKKFKNDDLYWKFIHTQGSMHIALKEYELAVEKLEISKEYAFKNKDLRNSLIILEDLSKAYEKMGDLKSSLETARMIQPIMDSLDLQKIKEEVAKLKSQRELKEKEKEAITLQEEKKTITLQMNKVQLISYILGGLLLIGGFVYFNRLSVSKAKFHKLNEKVNHNRLLSLQSAMNPHFLFNTFGTLQHFILKEEIKKANSYMTTLSDLIRNVFASSNSIYICFNDEIKILKSYVELELGRFDHSFDVSFEIPKELTDDNPMIPSMILQPYVENAIIHGFSEKKGAKRLSLKFTPIGRSTIQCEITDNGVGRKKVEEIQKKSKAKTKKNLSIATKNTEERLRIIDKKDEQEGNIVIHDLYDTDGNAAGTKVVISLPIIKSKND